jgi:ribose transport system ATP-binding protein
MRTHGEPQTYKGELLRAESISRSFGATQALARADISLTHGEVQVLLGENGAGKSTLAKVLSGLYPDRSDRIFIHGEPVQIGSVRAARHLGIATVFQELSLIGALSVAENLALARDCGVSSYRWLRRREEVNSASQLMIQMGFDIPASAPVADLSAPQRQIVEVAKAFIQQPRVLIMDEPTSLLSAREEPLIFAALRRFTAAGGAVLYVTHRIHEAIAIGSSVSLMRQGRIVETRKVDGSITERQLIGLLTRESTDVARVQPKRSRGDQVVAIKQLHAGSDCHGVSFDIHGGEVVGLYGVSGCGRESSARSLAGLSRIRGGTIEYCRAPWRPRSASQAAKSGIAYLPSGRKEQGILAQRSVRENLTLSRLNSISRYGFISTASERQFVDERLNLLAVTYRSMEDPIGRLSGGNQQKILFGRALRDGLRLAILEDPTAGVDLQSRAQIHQQIAALAGQGVGVLLVSNDLRETLSLSDRVHVLRAGRIAASLEAPFVGGERAVLDAMMGEPP